jgi:hypothetical protein
MLQIVVQKVRDIIMWSFSFDFSPTSLIIFQIFFCPYFLNCAIFRNNSGNLEKKLFQVSAAGLSLASGCYSFVLVRI